MKMFFESHEKLAGIHVFTHCQMYIHPTHINPHTLADIYLFVLNSKVHEYLITITSPHGFMINKVYKKYLKQKNGSINLFL